jgi:hypothetical protein
MRDRRRALHGAHHPALDRGEGQVHSRENFVRVKAGGGNRGALVCVALAGLGQGSVMSVMALVSADSPTGSSRTRAGFVGWNPV